MLSERRAALRLAIPVVVAILATACSGGHPSGSGSSPQAGVEAAAGSPGQGRCPLTSKEPPAGVSSARAVLAVKVDGSLAAAPQTGLESADVVYDEPVEGGIGWFLALFQCGDPAQVGPVREVRPEDGLLLQPYGSALYANAGGPQAVTDALKSVPGVVTLDSTTAGSAYSRNSMRLAPHNLYVNPAALRATAPKGSLVPLGPPRTSFVFGPASPQAGLSKASSVTFSLGPTVSYRYDATANAYLRSENGRADLAASGAQISVTNVVLLWVPITQAPLAGGNTTPNPVVVGQGNAMVLNNGVEHDGTWKRTDPSSPIDLLDSSGNPIPLTPGNTWIHLLPSDGTASVA